jgi:hypothetical protein
MLLASVFLTNSAATAVDLLKKNWDTDIETL